jgi:hypothetical protein
VEFHFLGDPGKKLGKSRHMDPLRKKRIEEREYTETRQKHGECGEKSSY